jgi:hypothetical protein
VIKVFLLFCFVTFSSIIFGQTKNHIDTLSGFDLYVLGSSKYNYSHLDSNTKSKNWFFTKGQDTIKINDPDGTYFLSRQYSSTELAFQDNKLVTIHLSCFPLSEATIGGGIAQSVINKGINEYGMFSHRIVTPDCLLYVWADQETTLTIRFTRETYQRKRFGNTSKENPNQFVMDVTLCRENF